MKNLFPIVILLCLSINSYSQSNISQQLSINNSGEEADASSILDIQSNNKGLLIPRMSTSERVLIENPATGLIVYDNDFNQFYYFHNSNWYPIASNNFQWIEDGNKLYNTSHKIGIGTNNPLVDLDVNGTSKTNNLIISNGAEDSFILQSNSEGLAHWTNSEEATGWQRASNNHIFNTGDSIGINTSTPLERLHIMGSNELSSVLISPNEIFSGKNASIILSEDNDDTYHMEMTYDGEDNRMYWYGKNNTSFNGPHMSINRDNGRVGIGTGTINPISELEVVGTVTATAFDAGDASGLTNVYADSIRGSMQADSNDILQWNGSKWNNVPFEKIAFHTSASDQIISGSSYDTLKCKSSIAIHDFEYPTGVFNNLLHAFEVPIDGIYSFEASALWNNSINLTDVRNAIFIRVNNEDKLGEWSFSAGSDYFTSSINTTLKLNKGDMVRVRLFNNDSSNMQTHSQNGKYCYFSGFLVSAI